MEVQSVDRSWRPIIGVHNMQYQLGYAACGAGNTRLMDPCTPIRWGGIGARCIVAVLGHVAIVLGHAVATLPAANAGAAKFFQNVHVFKIRIFGKISGCDS